MKLLKPTWVHHDDKPIFSVDVHQECSKFATGGQGVDSGRVVIWNLLPILSEEAELDDNVPKMLCQMDNHLACVNCVRWSQNGHMLASGSDDKLVMIWRKSKGSSGVFGTGGIQKNTESWKCSATLRGHSGDVLDLAWSPHDRWLASCSIDNTIIVWDVQSFPGMVAMLKGHTGLVKGVTWDPVGKYLASQSDDRSVKIWKTSDWTCSHTITEPFEECGGTTHILRLSWSPDGQYLVSAHAMNGGGPTAQIIEREGWKCDKDFVGHRKAVTCVRFHNAILKTRSSKSKQYCCLAVGSRDRSLSVWMTALQRPLLVVHDLFKDSVLDLSWGPAKCILLACSGDGTVACLQFDEEDLGTPLSEDDKNMLYQRIYGKVTTLENGTGGANDMLLIENPELLHSANDQLKPPTLPNMIPNHNNNFIKSVPSATLPAASTTIANGCVAANNNFALTSSQLTNTAMPNKAVNRQLETRTADGKRRITPVFIPLHQDGSDNVTSQLSSSSRPMVGTTTTTTTILSESAFITDTINATSASTSAMVLDRREELTAMDIKTDITEVEESRLDSRLIKCTNANAATASLNDAITTRPKIQPQQVNMSALKSFPLAAGQHSRAATNASGLGVTPAVPHQASTSGPKLIITPTSVCEFQKSALDHRVHVHNGNVRTSGGYLAKVTAYWLHLGAEKLWEIYVGSPIVNLNFCHKYVMLCSLDGTMRLLDMQTGIAVLPVMTLTTAAIQCAFCPHGNLVGVITDCGLLRIWNIAEERVTLATTCHEVFGKFGAVLQLNITEHGVPLIMFANGNSYSYSQRLQSWLVLNTKDPIMRNGLQTTMPKGFQKNFRLYPLTSVQASTTSFASNSNNYSGAIDLNTNNWQSISKISFIENQIKLCEAINSPEELKHWYSMLAYHVALSGTEQRLRLLLNDLLGPAIAGELSHDGIGGTRKERSSVLSIPKLVLLEVVLNVLKSHAKWQRIYMEYYELFENSKNEQQSMKMETLAKHSNDDDAHVTDNSTTSLNLLTTSTITTASAATATTTATKLTRLDDKLMDTT